MTTNQKGLLAILVRVAMILGGGQLLEEGQWETAFGALSILAAILWSGYQKWRADQRLTEAKLAPAELPLGPMPLLPSDRRPGFRKHGKTVR
jgi:hypothetical protein